jgi:hypothetical protein
MKTTIEVFSLSITLHCSKHSLVTNPQSVLVATFQLVPSPLPIFPFDCKHDSTRPKAMYGPHQAWPLPYSPPAPIVAACLRDFLAHSAVGLALSVNGRDLRLGSSRVYGPGEDGARKNPRVSFVNTETRRESPWPRTTRFTVWRHTWNR